MPYPTDITYPTVATDADWQKKKSITDKLIKTKVGPALVLAKSKWDAIPFADLHHTTQAKTVTSANAALTKAKAAWAHVAPARAALKAAWTLSDTQKVNAKLAGSSKTALAAISVALKAADHRLDQMSDLVGLFQIDVNDTTKAAKGTWTNLEIKSGNAILAHAKNAKLEADGSYDVTNVTWASNIPAKMTLDYLQKKVKVTAHDGTGANHAQDMTITGISGSGQMRLK